MLEHGLCLFANLYGLCQVKSNPNFLDKMCKCVNLTHTITILYWQMVGKPIVIKEIIEVITMSNKFYKTI